MDLLPIIFYSSNDNEISDAFVKLWGIDSTLAKKVLLFSRDREMNGRKKPFYQVLRWLVTMNKKDLLDILSYIPIFGYWKDYYCLCGTEFEDFVVVLFSRRLELDKKLLETGDEISNLAKYAPREGGHFDRRFKLVKKICHELNITPEIYRKKFLSPLRKKLNIVESQMCARKWNEINYNEIGEKAIQRYTTSFTNHDPERFFNYTKRSYCNIINVLIIDKYLSFRKEDKFSKSEDLEQMWEMMKIKNNIAKNFSIVVDITGSMTELSLSIALAITLLSGVEYSTIGNSFKKLEKGSVFDFLSKVFESPWNNFFDLNEIRKTATGTILIIGDSDINSYVDGTISFDPKPVIFWNVSNKRPNITDSAENIISITGYSDLLFEHLLREGKVTPGSYIDHCLSTERYQLVE